MIRNKYTRFDAVFVLFWLTPRSTETILDLFLNKGKMIDFLID